MKKIVAAASLFAALALVAAPASARQSDQPNLADAGSIVGLVTGLLPEATTETCRHPLVENPFTFLGDVFDYVLAPDGSFEGAEGDGWLLDGGAAPIAGNDPFPIHADGPDATILNLPSGSSAVSAPMCVDLNYPHFRVVVRQLANEKGRFKGRLRVDTMYPNSNNPQWRKVDVIRPQDGEWVVSDFLDLEPERGGSAPGGRQVSLRFSVQGGGDDGEFEIDDVYVDPRFRV